MDLHLGSVAAVTAAPKSVSPSTPRVLDPPLNAAQPQTDQRALTLGPIWGRWPAAPRRGRTVGAGTLLSQQRYLPALGRHRASMVRCGLEAPSRIGEVRTDRFAPGAVTQTDFGYSDQRDVESLGLMDYKARFYDPSLGRFTQADTIVPSLARPRTWNRYSYVVDNPIRFSDPTGHYMCEDDPCENPRSILANYGIGVHNMSEDDVWQVVEAAEQAAQKEDSDLDTEHQYSPSEIFNLLHGNMTIIGVADHTYCETNGRTIDCGSEARYATTFLHEFGHVLENNIASIFGRSASNLDSVPTASGVRLDYNEALGVWQRTTLGFKCRGWDWNCFEHPARPSENLYDGRAKIEQWGDLFMNWVLDETGDPYHGFTTDPMGMRAATTWISSSTGC